MTNNEFFTTWLKNFASDIDEENINRYVIGFGECIWHVFSWKLTDEKNYLVGDTARQTYDKMNKVGAIYIDWYEDDNTNYLTQALSTSKALDDFIEVYVVGKDFEWTYIKTHEQGLGPYFMFKK